MNDKISFFFYFALSILMLTRSQIASAAPYYDEQRASGVWVFDLFATDVEKFVTASVDEAAKMICADDPAVKGFATRISWRNIEPVEGKFDWRYTDRLFEIAEKYDKLVALRVIGWENWESKEASPQWLWKNISQYVDRETTWHETTRVPYLGGETKFLEYWLRLNRALGARYADNPRLQRIHMSTGHDQEMYYIKDMSPEQVNTLCPEGIDVLISDLLEHWHKSFICYKEAFPNKAYVLDLTMPIRGVKGVKGYEVLDKIIADASDVLGAQLYLQQDGLSERNIAADKIRARGNRSIRALMLRYSDIHMLGLETLLPPQQKGKMPVAPPDAVFYSDLGKTIQVGLTFPVRYMEFWIAALKDPRNRKDIQYAKTELEKRAAKE